MRIIYSLKISMKSTLIYNGEFQVVRIKNFTGGKGVEIT